VNPTLAEVDTAIAKHESAIASGPRWGPKIDTDLLDRMSIDDAAESGSIDARHQRERRAVMVRELDVLRRLRLVVEHSAKMPAGYWQASGGRPFGPNPEGS